MSQVLCYEPDILDIVIFLKNYVARRICCKAISTVTLFNIWEISVYFCGTAWIVPSPIKILRIWQWQNTKYIIFRFQSRRAGLDYLFPMATALSLVQQWTQCCQSLCPRKTVHWKTLCWTKYLWHRWKNLTVDFFYNTKWLLYLFFYI